MQIRVSQWRFPISRAHVLHDWQGGHWSSGRWSNGCKGVRAGRQPSLLARDGGSFREETEPAALPRTTTERTVGAHSTSRTLSSEIESLVQEKTRTYCIGLSGRPARAQGRRMAITLICPTKNPAFKKCPEAITYSI